MEEVRPIAGIMIVASVFVGLSLGQEQREITFEEVNNRFGMHSTSNELRKNEEWKVYEGKCVEWIGELSNVTDMFSELQGITLGFKHLRSTFTYDVQVSAPVSEKEKFMDLRIGNRYRYRATLRDYGGVILPIRADWGCRTDVNVTTNIEYQGVLTTSDLSAVTTGEEIQNELQPQEPKPADRAVVPDPNATLPDVTALLEAGADLNARDENGWTPLHTAAAGSKIPGTVTALLEAGADLNAREENGWTPLHLAAGSSETPGIIAALLEAGADPNVRGENGQTPLHTAAGSSKIPGTVTALLEAGADLNARDENGWTPLHTAAGSSETPGIVEALLEAGADLNARVLGWTPLHMAAEFSETPGMKPGPSQRGIDLLEAGAEPGPI